MISAMTAKAVVTGIQEFPEAGTGAWPCGSTPSKPPKWSPCECV